MREIILAKNATPIEDDNDRSQDEQYFAARPIATGLLTMRFAGRFYKSAHETNALALAKNATLIEDLNDRTKDEEYFKDHPLAMGLPTMK